MTDFIKEASSCLLFFSIVMTLFQVPCELQLKDEV